MFEDKLWFYTKCFLFLCVNVVAIFANVAMATAAGVGMLLAAGDTLYTVLVMLGALFAGLAGRKYVSDVALSILFRK